MKKMISILLVALTVASCQSQYDKDLRQITESENALFNNEGMIDRSKLEPLLEQYTKFAEAYPDDTLAPVFLFKAGDMAMNTNRSVQAIQFYSRIINEYPEYVKAPEALFLLGYVYENNLGRLDRAKEIYEEFLARYPENDFADDAKISLKYLGKSPEELIEIFQQKATQEE